MRKILVFAAACVLMLLGTRTTLLAEDAASWARYLELRKVELLNAKEKVRKNIALVDANRAERCSYQGDESVRKVCETGYDSIKISCMDLIGQLDSMIAALGMPDGQVKMHLLKNVFSSARYMTLFDSAKGRFMEMNATFSIPKRRLGGGFQ